MPRLDRLPEASRKAILALSRVVNDTAPFVRPSTVFREPTGSQSPFDHTSFIKTLLLWAGVDPDSV